MELVKLGKTGMTVNRNGFGALPIQRVSAEYAGRLLRRAFEAGINFFDTARSYTDSEEKIGLALASVREKIFIATKTPSTTAEGFWKDLETSLRLLKTDYIDLYQFHNPEFVPKPGDGTGLYEAMLEAKEQGKIRHIGITNHRIDVATEAVESGLYETMQFPFCYLTTEKELELLRRCRERDMGFIAMKALSGGLLNNAAAAYAWMSQYDDVVPIWGIQREAELEQFLHFADEPPSLEEPSIRRTIEADRACLQDSFCRSCGYCMPCPAGIQIFQCARMSQLVRRMPSARWLSPQWQAEMEKIEGCLECGSCKKKCPYGLDTPALLKKNLADYRRILAGEISVS